MRASGSIQRKKEKCFDSVHESVNQLECASKLARMCFSMRLLRNLALLDIMLLRSVCHSTCFLCYTIFVECL